MPDAQPTLQGESVDRIRDIIFGPKMRDYELRFEAIVRDLDRLQQELDQLSEQLTSKDATQAVTCRPCVRSCASRHRVAGRARPRPAG